MAFTTLVFFQVVLLLGYGYAHLGARLLSARRQALLHLLLIPLAALVPLVQAIAKAGLKPARLLVALPAGAVDQVAWSLHDSQGNKLTTGSFKPSALGGFDLSITLPKTPNLGDAYLNFEVQAGRMKAASFAHSLQIQEFRRPEYEVKASADAGPHLVGGHADLEVSAQYFAGGPLASAEVHFGPHPRAVDLDPVVRADVFEHETPIHAGQAGVLARDIALGQSDRVPLFAADGDFVAHERNDGRSALII